MRALVLTIALAGCLGVGVGVGTAAAARPSASGYRFLGEGSAFVAWAKGARVYKVLKLKKRYTPPPLGPDDPARDAVVAEQLAGHAKLTSNAAFRARWGHVTIPRPSRTARAGVIETTLVEDGVTFRDLALVPRLRASWEVARIVKDAVAAFEHGYVTDSSRDNFRFDARGRITAWLDPVHTSRFHWAPDLGASTLTLTLHRQPTDAHESTRDSTTPVARIAIERTGTVTRLPLP